MSSLLGEGKQGRVEQDIGAFLDHFAGQADVDPGRIGVTGGSYGGYMTLATLVHYSERLRSTQGAARFYRS